MVDFGPEFIVNSTTTNDQIQPTVTTLSDGRFVVTWWSAEVGTGWDIRARLFDASGNAVGNDFVVNPITADDQTYSTVAALPDGGFVVTWESRDNQGNDIRARLFDASGNAVGSDFVVTSADSLNSANGRGTPRRPLRGDVDFS